MENEKLKSYIYSSLQAGLTTEEITKHLQDSGWDDTKIREGLEAVRNILEPSHNQDQQQDISNGSVQDKSDPGKNDETNHEPVSSLPMDPSSSGHLESATSESNLDTSYPQQAVYTATGRRRGRIKTSFLLMTQTFSVLWNNMALFRYPFIGGFIAMVIGAIFIAVLIPLLDTFATADETVVNVILYGALFVYYAIAMFVIFTYNAALTANVLEIFKGQRQPPSVYMKIAWSKKTAIFSYSLITATFGILMNILERVLGKFAFILRLFMELVWSLANIFTLSIIVETDSGGLQAVKESISIFKKRWGENVATKVSFVGLTFLIYTVASIFAWGGLLYILHFLNVLGLVGGFFSLFGGVIGFYLILYLYFLPYIALEQALNNILNTALYYYAVYGKVPPAFRAEMLNTVFIPKRKFLRR